MNEHTFKGESLKIEPIAKYIGITLEASARDYLSLHTSLKAKEARKNTGVILSLEHYTGQGRLPPSIMRDLYFALVDCHLTHGADIAPDVREASIVDLEMTQKRFLRAMLGVSNHSVVAPLFTETGIMPIHARRVDLGLRFLLYVMDLPENDYMQVAMRNAQKLKDEEHFSWLTDLDGSLQTASAGHLALPHLRDITADSIHRLTRTLKDLVWDTLDAEVSTSTKLYLLHNRLEPFENGTRKKVRGCFRHYLRLVTLRKDRQCLTKVLFAESAFRMHTMHDVARDERLCRLCNRECETPEHVLIVCESSEEMNTLRNSFLVEADRTLKLTRPQRWTNDYAVLFLQSLIFNYSLVNETARYIYKALKILDSLNRL